MDVNDTQQSSVTLQGSVTEDKKIRFSGVELLRIIAIFLICINHAVQTSEQFIDYDNVLSVGTVFLKILRCSGQIGNILFVICSSYFLTDSKRTKGKKALNLLLDSVIISVVIFIGFLIGGYKFTASEILRQFVPDLWFIPTYVLFYAIHPLLNGAIDRISQKTLFAVVFVIYVILGITQIFVRITTDLLNKFTGFISIYLLVAYMKKYMVGYCRSVKKNAIVFVVFTLFYSLCAVLRYVLGMRSSFIKGIVLDDFTSPILLPALLSLFNLFNSLKFKNKAINYLASCSLFVYCIHENPLLRSIVRPMFYQYVFGLNFDLYFLWIMICAVGMFLGAYVLSILYKETAHRLSSFLSKKICLLLAAIIGFFYNKSVKFNEQCEGTLTEKDIE